MLLCYDTEKFIDTGLGLHDYMILVLYKIKDDYTAFDISKMIGITERTCYRKRKDLVYMGWLIQHGFQFYLSDKTKLLIAA